MTTLAVIPARLGSKRLERKNLRYLGGRPLLAWVVETALGCEAFDEVLVSTESDLIAALADSLGCGVLRRDPALAKDGVTSEQIVRHAIDSTDCDAVVQVTPTSPFLTAADMGRAVEALEGQDTVLPVRRIQAECVNATGGGVNVDLTAPMRRSQDLDPVFMLCNGLFAWDAVSFRERQDETGAATLSGTRTRLMELRGHSALDIDTADDFALAEAVALTLTETPSVRYWSPGEHVETDDDLVLKRDGLASFDLGRCERANLWDVVSALPPDASSARRVVEQDGVCMTVISQMPGEGNRLHWHPIDEVWQVLEGRYYVEMGDEGFAVGRGDLVQIPRGTVHRITAIGAGRAVRLATSRPQAPHVYVDRRQGVAGAA